MRDRASLIEQMWRAQAALGLRVFARVLAGWADVSPLDLGWTTRRWLAAAIDVIRGERRRSQRAAIAFLRLYRALETGYTLPPPGDSSPSRDVSLGDLRDEWAQAAGVNRPRYPDDGRVIRVELDFEWPEPDERRLDDRAVASLVATGVSRAYAIADDEDRLPSEVRADMESAGRAAANAAQQEALRSGREVVDEASQRDRRVLGWMRVTDDDPCHFCALLASRGVVYRSAETAARRRDPGRVPASWGSVARDELSKYHPRCACQVVPVYTRDDPRLAESRRLYDEYRRVTRGKSGADARRAWRHYIESRR
mgnify:CR=1 FL=1